MIILAVTVILVATGVLGLGFQHSESEGSRKKQYKSSPKNIEAKEVHLEAYQTFLDVIDDSMEEEIEEAASDRGMTVQQVKEIMNKEG